MTAATTPPAPSDSMLKCFHFLNDYLVQYDREPIITSNIDFTSYEFLTDNLRYKLYEHQFNAVKLCAYDTFWGKMYFGFYIPCRRDHFFAIMRILDIK